MRLVSFAPLLRPTAGQCRRFAVALAVGLSLLMPSALPAGAQERPATRGAADPALDRLFAALAAAPDDSSAATARTRIEAAWGSSGSPTADLLMVRAATAAHGGDAALSLDLLDAAIVVAPDWAGARHRRALLHVARHNVSQAIADLEATLRLEPRHFGAMVMLAAILDEAGRKAEALQWLRRVAVIDPREPGLARQIERLTTEVEGRAL